MASTMKRPPVWNTGLIRPERTRAQKTQGLSPSSPRTPTIGERAFRGADRWASIVWWTKFTVLAAFAGLIAAQYLITVESLIDFGNRLFSLSLVYPACQILTKFITYAFGVWFLKSVLESSPPLGGKAGRALARFRRWWAENRDGFRFTLRGVPGGVGGFLRIFPIVWRAFGNCRTTEDAPATRTITRAEPTPTNAEPSSLGGWKKEENFMAARYSRDRVSPRALRAEKITYLIGTTPDWVDVLETLSLTKLAALDVRTQYYRRRGKGLVTQVESDEYDEDGDGEDDGEPLPLVSEPVQFHALTGTTDTKIERRFASLRALRNLRIPFALAGKTHINILGTLSFEQVQEIYKQSQIVRSIREGLYEMDHVDNGYDFGQSEGASDEGLESEEDDTSVPSTRRRATAHPFVYDLPPHSRQTRGRSSKRNVLVPRRGGEAAKPIYLAKFDPVPTMEKKVVSGPTTHTPSQEPESPESRIGHSVPKTQPPSTSEDSSNIGSSTALQPIPTPRNDPTPKPAVNAEAAKRARSSTPGPERRTLDSDSMPVGESSSLTISRLGETGTSSTPMRPSSECPATTSEALQPILRSLALKTITLRTDCIAIWTSYHQLERHGWPIGLEKASQKLLQQAAALENIFETAFNVTPRPPMISYMTKLPDIERHLDDALGLLQLFRQALDAENPSCPILRKARNCLAGISQGITKLQGIRWKGTDASVSNLRRQRLRLLIPDFAVEDELAARIAEELSKKEKAQRDCAKKEKAEKRRAEEERIAAMSPMDSTEDKTCPVPAAKPLNALPAGTSYREFKDRYPIDTRWTPNKPKLRGPAAYIQALQIRVSQGFLPTLTSSEALMSGLRAVVISLESMGRLPRGQVTPIDILRKMFVDPEIDPMHDSELFPDGPRGRPTTIYQRFLDERKDEGLLPGGLLEEVLSLRNFGSCQLSYVLRLLNDFDLESSGAYFPLGIVTAGSRDSPASVQIIHTDGMPLNSQNVVWVFNDGNEVYSGYGKGTAHWSGFARYTTDRQQWLEEVSKWGLKIPDAVEQAASSEMFKEPAQESNNSKHCREQKQSGPKRSFSEEWDCLEDLTIHFRSQGVMYDLYEARPPEHLRDIRNMIEELEKILTPKVKEIQNVGTREERDKIIEAKNILISRIQYAIAELRALLRRHGRDEPNWDRKHDYEYRGGNDAHTRNQSAGSRSQSAPGHDRPERGCNIHNDERPDNSPRNRSDDGASSRGQDSGRKSSGEDNGGDQFKSDFQPGPEHATDANARGLGAGRGSRGRRHQQGGGNGRDRRQPEQGQQENNYTETRGRGGRQGSRSRGGDATARGTEHGNQGHQKNGVHGTKEHGRRGGQRGRVRGGNARESAQTEAPPPPGQHNPDHDI